MKPCELLQWLGPVNTDICFKGGAGVVPVKLYFYILTIILTSIYLWLPELVTYI